MTDNQADTKMVKNDASSGCTKHIDIKYHLVRNLIKERAVAVEYCPNTNKVADQPKKPLGRTLFNKYWTTMGLEQII